MANTSEPGRVRVGHIADASGDDGTLAQSATLTFDVKGGVELYVAYLFELPDEPNPQFVRANRWFSRFGEELPKTLLFIDDSGVVTLHRLRASHIAHGSHPLGRARAAVTIFERPREFRDEYLVKELTSTIDGLEEFARFEPVTHDVEYLPDGHHRTTVVVESVESVEWVANGYSYAIKSNVSWAAQSGRYFHIVDSEPYILTRSDAGASPFDHLAAQWPIRALLILTHGRSLAWRSHRLRDDQFPMWMMDGSTRDPQFVEVQFQSTIAQHSADKVSSPHFSRPPLQLRDLTPDALAGWVTLYGDDVFEQAVQPAVEVLNGASRFLEPQLMMLAISLDRFGYFRFGDRRRRLLFENIEKCMEAANIDWPTVGSRRGIAKAIANLNNDLKHPDREANPPSTQLLALTELCKLIVRAQIFDLLRVDDRQRDAFVTRGNDALNALRVFADGHITISDSGVIQESDEGADRSTD